MSELALLQQLRQLTLDQRAEEGRNEGVALRKLQLLIQPSELPFDSGLHQRPDE